MRLFKPNISKMQKKGNFKGLIRALQDSDWEIRRDAATTLGEIGDARAVDSLANALDDDNDEVCAAAATALGEIGGERAVDSLANALDNDKDIICTATAKALGKIGGKRATEILRNCFRNSRSAHKLIIYYSALEAIQDVNISEIETEKLVNSVAAELRSLSSRTRTVTERKTHYGEWDGPLDHPGTQFYREYVEESTHVEADPDIKGIRALIEMTPVALHSKIREQCGDAKYLSVWREH